MKIACLCLGLAAASWLAGCPGEKASEPPTAPPTTPAPAAAAPAAPAPTDPVAPPPTAPPTDPAATPVARGTLDKEVIRRIVRRHINEVKYCYERELEKNPALGGKVNVSFTIAPTGQVSASSVANTTLGSAAVEGCLAAAVRRWTFPAPKGGGPVQVTYPFILNPKAPDPMGDAGAATPAAP